MAPDDSWFIGSATKTFTAAVILRLAEERRLSLDDPLGRFLPDFPDADRITLRHLLAQTSGLKDFYLYLYLRPDRAEMIELVTREWTEAELLGLAGRFGRHFEPGTDWDYSSTNYYLLGVVIERVTGTTLAQAYRRYLGDPLGLASTWLHRHETALGTVPIGYLSPVAAWKHAEMFGALGPTTNLDRSSVELAAGGLVASAADGTRFLSALVGGRLLADASLAAMRSYRATPPLGLNSGPRPPDLPPDGYGLGLVRLVRPGFTLEGHGGLYNGHTAGLWSIAGTDRVVALYFNRGFIDQRAALDRIVPAVLGGVGAASR
jgi:D-alanyl-D-alanine carboxypeptidase